MIIYVIVFLILIILPLGFGVLVYKSLFKSGQQKAAKYFAIIYTLIFAVIAINLIFEDELFSKDNAKHLLEQRGFILKDNFELSENESMSAIGDYYHTFTLKVSKTDAKIAMDKIISSKNFKKIGTKRINLLYDYKDRYKGSAQTENYETESSFVNEYFKPNGKGYAPTFIRITVSKTENEIEFEDIVE